MCFKKWDGIGSDRRVLGCIPNSVLDVCCRMYPGMVARDICSCDEKLILSKIVILTPKMSKIVRIDVNVTVTTVPLFLGIWGAGMMSVFFWIPHIPFPYPGP